MNGAYADQNPVPADAFTAPITYTSGNDSYARNCKLSMVGDAVGTLWVHETVPHGGGPLGCWSNPALDQSNAGGMPLVSTLGHINARQFPTLGSRSNTGDAESFPTARHLDTMNTLFLDGHVKAIKLDSLRVPSSGSAGVIKAFTIEDD